jgi:hypothetical protein
MIQAPRHTEPAQLTGKVHARVEECHRSREFANLLKLLDAAYPANHSAHVSNETKAAISSGPCTYGVDPPRQGRPSGAIWPNCCGSIFAHGGRHRCLPVVNRERTDPPACQPDRSGGDERRRDHQTRLPAFAATHVATRLSWHSGWTSLICCGFSVTRLYADTTAATLQGRFDQLTEPAARELISGIQQRQATKQRGSPPICSHCGGRSCSRFRRHEPMEWQRRGSALPRLVHEVALLATANTGVHREKHPP